MSQTPSYDVVGAGIAGLIEKTTVRPRLFDGKTSLSDTAAKSLSKYKGDLSIDLDELPESVAQILRDVGKE